MYVVSGKMIAFTFTSVSFSVCLHFQFYSIKEN